MEHKHTCHIMRISILEFVPVKQVKSYQKKFDGCWYRTKICTQPPMKLTVQVVNLVVECLVKSQACEYMCIALATWEPWYQ